MRNLLTRWIGLLAYSAVVSTFIMMCLTTADAVGRYVFNKPIIGACEITASYLIVTTVFFGASYAYQRGGFIRITFLVEQLPRKAKLAIGYFVQVFSALYSSLLVVVTALQALSSISTTGTMSSLDLPLWPGYIIVPVGLFFMFLLMLLDIPQVRKGKAALLNEQSPMT